MTKFARLLLIAMLALLLPFQGALAVSAAQCMAFEHHQDAANGQGHDHSQHGHQADDHAQSSHGGADQAVSGDEGSADSHCGPCVGSCASVSIAGPAYLPLFAVPHHAVTVSMYVPPIGGLPNGLDRPPHTL